MQLCCAQVLQIFESIDGDGGLFHTRASATGRRAAREEQLAQQCASHTHPDTGTPTNASAFTQTAGKAGQTRSKYQGIIA
ncbi:hypothetical protein Y71_06230 [Kosakonia radicincitans DSM 16656]|nr:hypothetical protein Y71_06230 [Kosakonia radicincitans DSM 16656]